MPVGLCGIVVLSAVADDYHDEARRCANYALIISFGVGSVAATLHLRCAFTSACVTERMLILSIVDFTPVARCSDVRQKSADCVPVRAVVSECARLRPLECYAVGRLFLMEG